MTTSWLTAVRWMQHSFAVNRSISHGDDPRELRKIYLITPLRIGVTLELTEHRKHTSYGSRPVCKHGPGSFLCHLKSPSRPVRASCCQHPRGIEERLDPPEIKRRPG